MPVKVYWTRQSREDLHEIRAFIARNAPLTAAAFVRRIRESVKRVRVFPELGQVVPELGRNDVREFLHGNYRVIYRVAAERIDILTVFHSARLLDETHF
jgi:plasmid stabilization system protein ParE